MKIPETLVYPCESFADDFKTTVLSGHETASQSSFAFVGLARNCDQWLRSNLERLELLVSGINKWCLHIETNDNQDNTDHVLVDFCSRHRQATFVSQKLDRKQFSTEFAGPRTIALAEYRNSCQRWVKDNAAHSEFTVVVDWDAWGGWSHAGVLHGIGMLQRMKNACGMASVSLMQHPQNEMSNGCESHGMAWLHYDAWALRLNSYWDDYTRGVGGWKHHWIPPVGSPPVPVCSAFGGMCIYRTADYIQGAYDGSADCEHVSFHESVAARTGRSLFLNPSQRMIMSWCEEGGHGGPDEHD